VGNEENVPAGQVEQVRGEKDDMYAPAGHTQDDVPGKRNSPALHEEQTEAPTSLNEPAGHLRGTFEMTHSWTHWTKLYPPGLATLGPV